MVSVECFALGHGPRKGYSAFLSEARNLPDELCIPRPR